MELIETTVFTRRVTPLLSDDEYRALQLVLMVRPEAGRLIPGSGGLGGLRKLRWALPGRGKRGGARIIYYWKAAEARIFLLFLYAKNETDDLTLRELRHLREALNAD